MEMLCLYCMNNQIIRKNVYDFFNLKIYGERISWKFLTILRIVELLKFQSSMRTEAAMPANSLCVHLIIISGRLNQNKFLLALFSATFA